MKMIERGWYERGITLFQNILIFFFTFSLFDSGVKLIEPKKNFAWYSKICKYCSLVG